MKKRVIFAVILTLLILFVFAIPALAAVIKFTGTGFSYVGDVFHQKEVTFDGGSINFQVMGRGEAGGFHQVHTSAADAVYVGQKNVNLSASFYGTTALDAVEGEYMRILATTDLGNRGLVQTGVEMNPGENGYIRQNVASSVGPDGDYLKVSNNFGNTGGITQRNLEVGEFVNESMSVIGSAEVWESTTVRSGTARTGFWDTAKR